MNRDLLLKPLPESGIGFMQKTCPVGDLESVLYRHMAADFSAPAVFVADPGIGFCLLHASETCRYFGNSRETLQGITLPEYIPTLSPDRLKQLWLDICEYRTISMETDFRRSSGQRIAIEIIFSLLEHDGRKLMAGYVRDISDRHALEAERLRLAEQVAERKIELRYREIFENFTDGIFLLDVVHIERFRLVGINPAMVRMTGMIQMDILGHFVEDILPEHSARKMIANCNRCVQEGTPIKYELELLGGKKLFDSTLIPARDGGGSIHRIISLTGEITERK